MTWSNFTSFVWKSLERHVPSWVTSPALEFGKYGYSRHVESSFYCFLLVDEKYRAGTAQDGLLYPGEGRDLRAHVMSHFVILLRPGSRVGGGRGREGELLTEKLN